MTNAVPNQRFAARNARIAEQFANGQSAKSLGTEFNLSEWMIRQILSRNGSPLRGEAKKHPRVRAILTLHRARAWGVDALATAFSLPTVEIERIIRENAQ